MKNLLIALIALSSLQAFARPCRVGVLGALSSTTFNIITQRKLSATKFVAADRKADYGIQVFWRKHELSELTPFGDKAFEDQYMINIWENQKLIDAIEYTAVSDYTDKLVEKLKSFGCE